MNIEMLHFVNGWQCCHSYAIFNTPSNHNTSMRCSPIMLDISIQFTIYLWFNKITNNGTVLSLYTSKEGFAKLVIVLIHRSGPLGDGILQRSTLCLFMYDKAKRGTLVQQLGCALFGTDHCHHNNIITVIVESGGTAVYKQAHPW